MKYECGPYEPCPCGSGKKYKFCCAAANAANRHGKYPMGTVALYGPDDKQITTIAASVFQEFKGDVIHSAHSQWGWRRF